MQSSQAGQVVENSRTLWAGSLPPYVDEDFLTHLFSCECTLRTAGWGSRSQLRAMSQANLDPTQPNGSSAIVVWGAASGELVGARVMRDKQTGLSQGFAFLEFTTNAAAADVLNVYDGKIIPNTNHVLRLNWAAFGLGRSPEGTFPH